MTPEQVLALLSLLADMRMQISDQQQQIAALQEQLQNGAQLSD